MKTKQGISADEAVKLIQSGNRVFIHGSAATPLHVLRALQKRYDSLKDVELVSITTLEDIHSIIFTDVTQQALTILRISGVQFETKK